MQKPAQNGQACLHLPDAKPEVYRVEKHLPLNPDTIAASFLLSENTEIFY